MLFESGRTVPRPRHAASPRTLAALSPLFRYSHQRNAWVLRLIGERYGPVLRRAEAELQDAYESPRSRLRRRLAATQLSVSERASRVDPRGGSGLLRTLTVAGIAAAAALGFTVAHSGDTGAQVPALTGHAATGPLSLSVASDWRRVISPVATQLGLDHGIALSPARSYREMLVIGLTVTPDPQLLPRTLLESLASTPTPQTVSFGRARFYRYLDLRPLGGRSRESVYAMSTTIGTVLGVCITPSAHSSFIGGCERSLATLTIRTGNVLPLGPIPGYAAALNLAVKQLNHVRTTAGLQLLTAPGPKAQAQAANALAAAYARAAVTLSHLIAGPAAAANSAVVAALTQSQTAYRALARAASAQNSAAYSDARASVRRAASALTGAYSGLDAFGYSVS